MSDFVLVLVSTALVNHLILRKAPVSRLHMHVLGLCGALSVALGLVGGKLLASLILLPLGLSDLNLFLFLPLLALLAWAVPKALARLRPDWPIAGLQPALLVNVMVLGLLPQAISEQRDGLPTLALGVIAGLGFWLAVALFDDLRQRSQHAGIPRALRGLPIALLGAGVMAMAFSGFNGLFLQ